MNLQRRFSAEDPLHKFMHVSMRTVLVDVI